MHVDEIYPQQNVYIVSNILLFIIMKDRLAIQVKDDEDDEAYGIEMDYE